MRVLVVTPWFPSERGGWPAGFIADSVLGLVEAGASVGVLVAKPYYPVGLQRFAPPEHRGSIKRMEFSEIEFIEEVRYASLPGNRCLTLKNWLLDTFLERRFAKVIENFHPDLIHVHTELFAPPVLAASPDGIPIVVTIHGEHTNQKYIGSRGQRLRFSNSLSAVDRLVIVGEPLRKYASNLAQREDHIVCIWNGVNVPIKQRVVPIPDSEPIRFVCVSNLLPEKGVDLLFRSLAKLRDLGHVDWSLHLVGSGPEAELLTELSRTLGIDEKIEFLGNISNEAVFELLAEMDIFVLPSYREAFGVAYLEAMATGLAVVGVSGQGPGQFIENGKTGYLVPENSVEGLTECLNGLMSGPRRSWRIVASEAREFVCAKMTWKVHTQTMDKLYNTLVNKHEK